jgi:two-component system LytT family response regulator
MPHAFSALSVAVQQEPEELLVSSSGTGSQPVRCGREEFVLLTNDMEVWIVRIEHISLLEACRNFTRVHFSGRELVIKRALKECEHRLDQSIFFRASRRCIVNLSQVKEPRLSKAGRLIFLLRDGNEVTLSRRQTALFRATRGL